MGDSETVVAETSSVLDYTSAGYANTGYADPNANVVPNASGFPPADAIYTMDPNFVMQEAPAVGATDGNDNVAGTENVAVGSSQASGYGPVNGNVASEAGNVMSADNGNSLGVISGAAAGEECVDGSVPAMSGEEDRLWSIVKANSSDFNSWTALLEETEKLAEDIIVKIRRVYDAFFAEFPLCYGYWKKYADHEARVGSMDKVVEVYERAVQGVTYSVDIWLHYCIFTINTYGDPDTIRRLFERALAYVGTDYLSYPLWEKYIEYEYMQQEWSRVAMIYTRMLENPIQQLDRYLSSFKEFAGSRPLSELRSAEEAAATAGSQPEASGEVKVKEDEVQDAAENSPKHESAGSTEAEELGKYIAIREEMYKKAKEFDSKIIGFETAIKRPYFHVKPLSVAELENWHNYLDFIEREGDFNKVVKLYERCLIACANYPEYWIRYVLSMEASGSMDLADNALARATQCFVKRLPEIHLFAARFKEQNGDIEGAHAAYQLVHTEISPGLLEAIIKHANMERRLGKLDDAFSLYGQAIAIERGKEHSQTLPMLYAQYSRLLYLVSGNAEKAREILVQSLDHVQPSKPLLEALIHFESIQSPPRQIEYLESLVDKFIVPNSDSPNTANAAEKEELSCIFLEFLGLFGDAQSIKKAEDRHAKFFLPHRSMSELKKRHADDFLASERAKLAKSYSGAPSPAQSLMGSYPSAQPPYAAGYGGQPQAWPPVTQPQGQAQQWIPGYGQQAAYGAYSGYGSNYATPQVTTSVPQSATYGAYPPTYPAQQAFPQQSYAQPSAAAATLAPAQQPAPVPQAYYGSYY
ncbi:hypothetical protein Ddye_011768 [Dipteronia dyeriana]|uniref:Pre-mRNA-processing factor 39 n=1 Tax=Dipteronia dyeriana TaxID=168575 RepID=A0AAE0CHL9_9ROSI|nr:hypothetical protein Ddye_011768 [Dipteronia dyeriana]